MEGPINLSDSVVPEPVPYGSSASDSAADEFFSVLRDWRWGVASERGVPAFVVCDNATLRAIATELPADSAELLAIKGIGEARLEQYGDALLTLVEDWQNGWRPDPDEVPWRLEADAISTSTLQTWAEWAASNGRTEQITESVIGAADPLGAHIVLGREPAEDQSVMRVTLLVSVAGSSPWSV